MGWKVGSRVGLKGVIDYQRGRTHPVPPVNPLLEPVV